MDVTWKNFLNSLYNKGYVEGFDNPFTYDDGNEEHELLYYNTGVIIYATSHRKLVNYAMAFCQLKKSTNQLDAWEAKYLLGTSETCILQKNNHIYLRVDVSETFGPLEDLNQKFEFKSYWDEFPENFVHLLNTNEHEQQTRCIINKINASSKIRAIILS